MRDDRTAVETFSGVARLFPLPNLVLFPHVDQGLHIFEPRYRQMTAEALAGDQLIALVLLKPDEDWETDYDGRPVVESTACLGRITSSEQLPDGRYNLKLRGLTRLRLVEEIPDPDKLFRLARGEVLADRPPPPAEAVALRRELREAVLPRFDPTGPAYHQLTALFDSDTPLGAVCDLLGYGLPLPLGLKQQLLSEPDASIRTRWIIDAIGGPGRKSRAFPPSFSPN
ncbi:MAG: LON peptidase substrate-binding domain-containing protein [Fimbriiglobus sp.]|jgi:Lon protease-like protein|nr:LON peptidase substrate-binding domain-containing protein [Fimbriiglobus sp.]